MEWTRYLKGVDLWYLNDTNIVDEETKDKLLPPNMNNKPDFDNVVQKMLDEVGPIPRAFSNIVKYDDRSFSLRSTATLVEAINTAYKINDLNIPSEAKYFIAPYPKKRSEDQPKTRFDAPVCRSDLISWQFLSPTAEKLFIEAQLSEDQYQKLKTVELNYRIAESRVKQYLKKKYQDTWEWCQDVGYDRHLTKQQNVTPIPLPQVKYETLLANAFINQPVDTLEPNTLYYSRVHNFRLGDFVMVDHDKKICYFFQVTLSDLKDHPVRLSVLEDAMGRLKIMEKAYQLHIIFVTDKVLRFPTGSKFVIAEKVDGREMRTETTLRKLKNDNKWKVLTKSVETTVARAHLSSDVFHQLPETSVARK